MEKFIDTNEWVPVHTLPGFECAIEYYINRNGDLRSTKGGKDRILKRVGLARGYQKYTLQQRLGQKGEKQAYVHQLVALAFIGSPPTPIGVKRGCSCVDHCDEDKSNNHVSNLRWVSVEENITKQLYGKFQKIERTPEEKEEMAKIKREKATIRQRNFRARLKSSKIVEG